jgi:hypothetical protein
LNDERTSDLRTLSLDESSGARKPDVMVSTARALTAFMEMANGGGRYSGSSLTALLAAGRLSRDEVERLFAAPAAFRRSCSCCLLQCRLSSCY